MHKRMALNGLALLGLLASTTVLADTQPGFYAGAGVGKASLEIDGLFDEDDTSFRVFGGYNFNRYFAVEATYFDGGKPEATFRGPGGTATVEAATSGLDVSMLGRLPIGEVFSLYGKLGFASYDADVKARANGRVVFEETGSDEDVSYGIGAAFNLGPSFELRAEYDSIQIEDGDFTFLSVNGLFKF